MYEATVGRFCSRDPIGYEDGKSLFGNYLSLAKLDPSGLKIVKGMCRCSIEEKDELPVHAGGVISCENGILTPIVVRDTPEAIDLARCGFLDCNIEHENDHIDFYNEHCPGVCKKTRLGGDWCFADPIPRKKYRLMKIGPRDCVRATECRAYAASLKCIAKKLRALLRDPNSDPRCLALGIRYFSVHSTMYEVAHRCRDSDSPLNPQIELDPDVNEIGIWIVENDLFPKG